MLFNSLHFLFFFPIVVFLYFATPPRLRWILLLAASYYFYMCWKAEYAVLIVISTLIDYAAAIGMRRTDRRGIRRLYLVLSLITNLGLLFSFKYFNFFAGSVEATLRHFNVFYNAPELQVLLPVGISFYTFQTLSYTIDVYRGEREPERHLGLFAVYVAFFPQLVAGPIERSTQLLPQFRRTSSFNYDRVTNGLKLMAWGFFKKVVVADRLAVYVDTVYARPEGYHGMPIILATYFFAFQIYADFSGYTDIARGAAKIMGIDLMQNFRGPYFARSIREFWQRWHISLSTWFRDYVYIPLGGNRTTRSRWFINLMITFVVSGLWHGANWTFVVWGALHGAYLIAEILVKSKRPRGGPASGECGGPMGNLLRTVLVFHLTWFAWIFFRASSVSHAFLMMHQMVTRIDVLHPQIALVNFGRGEILISLAAICTMETVTFLQRKGSVVGMLSRTSVVFRWAVYLALVLSIYFLGVFNANQFIYFQF